MKKWLKEHPVLGSILITMTVGFLLSLLQAVLFFGGVSGPGIGEGISLFFILGGVFSVCFVFPFVLTVVNFTLMICRPIEEKMIRAEKWLEYITVILGVFLSGAYNLFISQINMGADWPVTLYNSQQHTLIWTEAQPTVLALALAGAVGYLILSWIPLKKMPPLVIVSSMAAMYLGTGECILWMIQIQNGGIETILLSVLPLNCVIITIKTVRRKVVEWNEMEDHGGGHYEYNSFLNAINNRLNDAEKWPLAALILMLPLLGIMICILVLFGQRPDAFIKAWTETADWSLSQRVAPPNVMYDEHYLCTVAAGGHRKVVKPIRMGVRHGHRVTVNRQLCIANAFEQILEERMPRIHRHVRHFYDTYGFPVARLIRSRYMADVVYFLMKPLEWFFLIVIYFCDVKPENRIAVQYLLKPETGY